MMAEAITAEDEYRHAQPDGFDGLFGDTFWVSVVDPNANIFGINHIHLTTKGYGRFEALYLIDGVMQLYGNKAPLDPEPDRGPWSDGNLTYEVVEALKSIRISFDGPRFGFELDFSGRFGIFNYADCVRGDPLRIAGPHHGGHFEQGMHCTGEFEIRGGPARGEVRKIDCFSHRDHTWSDRFAAEPSWTWDRASAPGHFWPSIQLPDRHINAFGLINAEKMGFTPETAPVGGFISDTNGSRPLHAASATVGTADQDVREATDFSFVLTMPDGEVIHVRSKRCHGAVKLWNRGENDLENRLDCYEAFVDWEIEETGETGTGVAEWSVHPPWPRWLP